MPRKLPLVYIGVAIANVLSTLAFGAVQSRVSRTASIVGTQVVLALSLVLARRLVETGSSSLYFGLVIWLEACSLLSITLFFSFAGDYFNPRDARRLYGFIAGGMSLGTVVSGYAISHSVRLIGTKNLLYVSALLLLCNAGSPRTSIASPRRSPADAAEEDAHAEHVSLRDDVRTPVRAPARADDPTRDHHLRDRRLSDEVDRQRQVRGSAGAVLRQLLQLGRRRADRVPVRDSRSGCSIASASSAR